MGDCIRRLRYRLLVGQISAATVTTCSAIRAYLRRRINGIIWAFVNLVKCEIRLIVRAGDGGSSKNTWCSTALTCHDRLNGANFKFMSRQTFSFLTLDIFYNAPYGFSGSLLALHFNRCNLILIWPTYVSNEKKIIQKL